MNHKFSVIWSSCRDMAVSELRKSSENPPGSNRKQGKKLRLKSLAVAIACCFNASVYANPLGAQVVNGAAAFKQTGKILTVNNSPNAIINWQSFSIAQGETTTFVQESANSAVLNRVLGQDPSLLLGNLSSNGKVFLINPSGILVGQGARIDVAGMVASTLNLSNSDFISGKHDYVFNPNAGSVRNLGSITTTNGGSVYLIATQVENQGIIFTPQGETILAAGNSVRLMDSGAPGVSVQITGSNNTATNLGQILADTGRIGMVGAVVKNSGNLNASSLVNQGGRILLKASKRVEAGGTISATGAGGGNISVLADMQNGTVKVSGTLDAGTAGAAAKGGFIETSAAHVQVADTARVSTEAPNGRAGNWLIDPTDYTIAATDPGNGSSFMSSADLQANLNAGNITIQTLQSGTGNGDIFINSGISWASAYSLTLNAVRNVNINAVISNSGSGNLLVRADQNAASTGSIYFGVGGSVALSGGGRADLYYNPTAYNNPTSYSASMGSTPYTAWMLVNNLSQLQAMNTNLSGSYALGANIDATASGSLNAGAGFAPVGDATNHFTGVFDGMNHTVSNLTINLPTTDYIGLFGYINAGSGISNLGLVGSSISGNWNVGALAGVNSGIISNSYATGNVSAGGNKNAPNGGAGGLVGYNSGTIRNSYATANVSGGNVLYFNNGGFGGLAGSNAGTISGSYATGNIVGGSGPNYSNFGGGGLVGNDTGGTISNSYATGNVSGLSAGWEGGLVGGGKGTISNSYATGKARDGGLFGFKFNIGTITNSYWDITSSGQADLSDGRGVGLTTAQMMQQATYAVWNIANTGGSGKVWRIYEGHTYPLLTSFLTPLTLTGAPDVTMFYNSAKQTAASIVASGNILGAAATGTNANFYNGYYSTQQGYDLIGGNMTISSQVVSLALSGSKVYDGTVNFSTAQLSISNVYSGDSVSLSAGTAQTADKNVGIDKPFVSFSGLMLTGASAGNYTLTGVSGKGSISKATLTLSGITASNKLYDGTTSAVVDTTNALYTGLVLNDAVTVNATGVFNNKNAGLNKTVILTSNYSGADTGNYNIISQASAIATINSLAVSIALDGNKIYDGTALFSTAQLAISNIANGDLVSLSAGTAQTADKNVGIDKPFISFSGLALTGASADNYTLTGVSGKGSISKAPLTLSGITAANKVYDSTTFATVSTLNALYTGLLSGDTVTVSSTGTFNDKNAGNNKTVTLNSSYSGADVNNYSIKDQQSTTANISKAPLTLSGITAASKKYDATTDATVNTTNAIYSGLLGSDIVKLSATGVFENKNAGTNKTVILTSNYTGADVGNYSITDQASTRADISKASLTISGITASNKVYDGSTVATVNTANAVYSGLLPKDAVTVNATGVFGDANVGLNKTVTLTSNYSGADVGNYTITDQTSTLTNIIERMVSITLAGSKVYDGTVNFTTAQLGISNVLSGDSVSLSAGTAQTADKNVGIDKTLVSFSGLALTGASAANYTLTGVTGKGTINAANLNINAVTDSKSYDGKTSSAGVVTYAGLQTGDTLTGLSQSFASKNVLGALGSTLNVNDGYVLTDGNGGKNYNIVSKPAAGTITQATLNLNAVTDSKPYDGTNSSIATVTPIGLQTGDTLTGLSQSFSSKNVLGTLGSTLNVNDTYVLTDGNSGKNYSIVSKAATGTITQATLNLNAVTDSKTYDGTSSSTATVTYTGLQTGDTLTGLSQSFASRHVLGVLGSTLNVNDGYVLTDGNKGLNYTINRQSATGTISQLDSVTFKNISGDWSVAANWGGATPDYNNVATVIIPSGATVTYDNGVSGLTTLNKLTSSGNLVVAANTLSIASYQQSAGNVSGTGNLNVTNSFSQTGGTITLTGNAIASITQLTGDLSVLSLSAPSVILQANTGAILNTVTASIVNLNSPSVKLTAATGLGSQSAPLQLSTVSLDASTTTGAGYISNTPTAAVTLLNFTTGDASPLTYKQDGQPLNLTGKVSSAGGKLIIDPPTTITMSPDASIVSSGGDIVISALGDIKIASIDAAAGGVDIKAGGKIDSVPLPSGKSNIFAKIIIANAVSGKNFSCNSEAACGSTSVVDSDLSTVKNQAETSSVTPVTHDTHAEPPSASPTPTSTTSSTPMPATFGPPGGTIGNDSNSFGGAPADSPAPGVTPDKSTSDKPADKSVASKPASDKPADKSDSEKTADKSDTDKSDQDKSGNGTDSGKEQNAKGAAAKPGAC